jgi:hypothetical protein
MPETNENKLTLDEVLISLQKSFSRVTDNSTRNEGTTALMVGNINFELEVRLTAENDKLFYDKDGDMALRVSGQIDSDLKEEQIVDPEKQKSS